MKTSNTFPSKTCSKSCRQATLRCCLPIYSAAHGPRLLCRYLRWLYRKTLLKVNFWISQKWIAQKRHFPRVKHTRTTASARMLQPAVHQFQRVDLAQRKVFRSRLCWQLAAGPPFPYHWGSSFPSQWTVRIESSLTFSRLVILASSWCFFCGAKWRDPEWELTLKLRSPLDHEGCQMNGIKIIDANSVHSCGHFKWQSILCAGPLWWIWLASYCTPLMNLRMRFEELEKRFRALSFRTSRPFFVFFAFYWGTVIFLLYLVCNKNKIISRVRGVFEKLRDFFKLYAYLELLIKFLKGNS